MILALAFGSLIAVSLMLVITDGADRRNEYLHDGK